MIIVSGILWLVLTDVLYVRKIQGMTVAIVLHEVGLWFAVYHTG